MASVYSFMLVALALWVASSNVGNINSFIFSNNDSVNINSFAVHKNDRGNSYLLNYTQKLEHFDRGRGLRKFKFQQRVLVNDSQWTGVSRCGKLFPPILAYFVGVDEELVDPGQIGELSKLAADFSGILISIEHRFTGGSIPLGSLDKAMENERIKKSLTIENTLQDYANIIQSFKANYSAEDSQVFVVGTGYGGALAKWFHQKYPEIAYQAHGIDTPKFLFERILFHDTPHNWCNLVSNNSKIAAQLFLECAASAFFERVDFSKYGWN